MSRCPSFEVLSAVADGVGGAEARHAHACVACSATLVQLHALGDSLRALPTASEGAPAGLHRTLQRLAPSPRRRAVLAAAALAAAMATMVAFPTRPSVPAPLAAEAVAQHLQGLAHDAGCELRTSDPAAIAAFLGQSGIPSPRGTELVGARHCSLFGETAGAVVYTHRGTAVTLFLPGPGSAAEAYCRQAGNTCSPGPQGQTVCVLSGEDPRVVVGQLPGPELCALAGS